MQAAVNYQHDLDHLVVDDDQEEDGCGKCGKPINSKSLIPPYIKSDSTIQTFSPNSLFQWKIAKPLVDVSLQPEVINHHQVLLKNPQKHKLVDEQLNKAYQLPPESSTLYGKRHKGLRTLSYAITGQQENKRQNKRKMRSLIKKSPIRIQTTM